MSSSMIALRLVLVAGLVLFARTARTDITGGYSIPEGGAIESGIYANEYFGLRYPLPANWTEDLKGPEPSVTGYYSLVALKPQGELTATMQISAQDSFFASDQVNSALDFLQQMKQHLDPSLSAPGSPTSIEIAGRPFARLDYNGAGLNHSVFATEIRCHTVIFSITSSSEKTIATLAQSLNKISISQEDARDAASGKAAPKATWPVCMREYVTPEHIVHKVDPVITGPRYASVPVRLIIARDGKVAHIHAIAGFPEQIKSVTDALAQWEFKPYAVGGHPAEVETGLLFQFPQVHSSAGSRE